MCAKRNRRARVRKKKRKEKFVQNRKKKEKVVKNIKRSWKSIKMSSKLLVVEERVQKVAFDPKYACIFPLCLKMFYAL